MYGIKLISKWINNLHTWELCTNTIATAIPYNLLVMLGSLLTTLFSASLSSELSEASTNLTSISATCWTLTPASTTPGDTGDGDLEMWMAGNGDCGKWKTSDEVLGVWSALWLGSWELRFSVWFLAGCSDVNTHTLLMSSPENALDKLLPLEAHSHPGLGTRHCAAWLL